MEDRNVFLNSTVEYVHFFGGAQKSAKKTPNLEQVGEKMIGSKKKIEK